MRLKKGKRVMKKYLFLLTLFTIVFISGCASKSFQPSPGDDQVRQQGEEIVSAVIAADYERFVAGSGDKSDNPEQDTADFKRSCRQLTEQFGTAESFRFLGELQTPLLINQIYAVRFIKTKNGNSGNIEHEQMFQLILGKQDGKYKLLGMRFI